jgi:RecB family exonuclease
MKADEFTSLIKELGRLIDARAKTTETLIKGEMKSVYEKIGATKEELRAEIVAARAEAKADTLHLGGKIDKIAKSQERRLESLEEKTGSPNVEKH